MVYITLSTSLLSKLYMYSLINQRTLQVNVSCEWMGPGPLGMCLPDLINLVYLQTCHNRYVLMCPRVFEMSSSLGDNNKLWHFPVSPLQIRQWLKLWWCDISNI